MAGTAGGAVRGWVADPQPGGGWRLWPDAVVEIDARGRIESVTPAPADCAVPVTHPGALWMPGFVDVHLHAPQTRVLGSAAGPLLEWLDQTVFPEEGRFGDPAYAAAVAEDFCAELARWGTTCAVVYGSSDARATHLLFEALDRWGLRALAGPTLMDRGAPPACLREAGRALAELEGLVERWHGHDDGRLGVVVTPRFALSCTPALLRGAGALASRHGLFVQTHLSENHAEIEATAAAFPEATDYLAVYEAADLIGPRTLLGHCVWLSDAEWARVAASGAVIAHCPDSNFFLGSGPFHLGKARAHGARVALGTDVGAGRSFSLRRIAASAFDTALLHGLRTEAADWLWMATLGGMEALGLADRIGRVSAGYDADLVAIDVGTETLSPQRTDRERLDALVFRHDAGPVIEARVRGRRVWPPGPQRERPFTPRG